MSWVAKFRLVGDDPGSLLDLDRELGNRRRRPSWAPMIALLYLGSATGWLNAPRGLARPADLELRAARAARYASHDRVRHALPAPVPDAPQHHVQSGRRTPDAVLALGAHGDADAGMGRRPPLPPRPRGRTRRSAQPDRLRDLARAVPRHEPLSPAAHTTRSSSSTGRARRTTSSSAGFIPRSACSARL